LEGKAQLTIVPQNNEILNQLLAAK
jgi:hypothetical protein